MTSINVSDQWYLTRLVLSGVGLVDLVVEPHVGHGHPVLGEGACLVRTDGGGGAQCLHGLQVLNQAVLTSHSLSGQRQTHLREKEKERERRQRNKQRQKWERGEEERKEERS